MSRFKQLRKDVLSLKKAAVLRPLVSQILLFLFLTGVGNQLTTSWEIEKPGWVVMLAEDGDSAAGLSFQYDPDKRKGDNADLFVQPASAFLPGYSSLLGNYRLPGASFLFSWRPLFLLFHAFLFYDSFLFFSH